MKKVSVILVDWNVRESFHAIDYFQGETQSIEEVGNADNHSQAQ